MSKAPYLHLTGRLGLNGKARIAVDGFASLTKSHGAYMVRAAITTSDARKILKLDEMKKRIPVARKAENRARAGPQYAVTVAVHQLRHGAAEQLGEKC